MIITDDGRSVAAAEIDPFSCLFFFARPVPLTGRPSNEPFCMLSNAYQVRLAEKSADGSLQVVITGPGIRGRGMPYCFANAREMRVFVDTLNAIRERPLPLEESARPVPLLLPGSSIRRTTARRGEQRYGAKGVAEA